MKKLMALGLVLSLVLALGACTGKKEGGTTTLPPSQLRNGNGQLINPPDDEENGGAKPIATTPQGSGSKTTAPGKTQRDVLGVTISEGRTIPWIASALANLGICDKQSLLKAARTMDVSSYSVASGAGSKANCVYKIEGYVFPATYDFKTNMKAEDVWAVMLRTMDSRFTAEDRARAKALGYSVNDILTIASILQSEAKNQDMKLVSSVIHNRLKKGWKLEMDSTINYVENHLKGNVDLPQSLRKAYNTYRCAALPAGPICNPGRVAIDAALYPASSDYLFFCTDKTGTKILYATTLGQHTKNCEELGIPVKQTDS